MVQLGSLVNFCNDLLCIQDFRDYCPNGLQVEGKSTVSRILTGVTASQDFIDRAVEAGVDAILVHHGYFWKNETPAIVGLKKNRIARLLQHDISLLAYHLPLDAHAEVGNNVQLARVLDLDIGGCVQQGPAQGLLWYGELREPLPAQQFASHIAACLNRQPQHLASACDQPVKTLAWCTGGAQGYMEQAAELGVDAYLSGEVSEQTFHLARELDLHYFAAGHHATERYGVQALGARLQTEFDIEAIFADLDNPV